MALTSILKPDTSVMLGVANGAIIIGVYEKMLPSTAAVRTADPHDKDIEAARKHAAWTSAAVLGFMFLLTRDRNSFLIGGLVLAGVDLVVKHSNGIDPLTGLLHDHRDVAMAPESVQNVYPMADYAEGDAGGY